MAGRSRQSHDKRQREKRKAEKASMKRARRQNREEGPEFASDGEIDDEPEPDKDALMERFRIINEKHAAGEISKEEFEEENNEILLALGVETE